MYVGVVDERVEGFPFRECQVRGCWGFRVLGAALCSPAELFGVRQGTQVVQGHHFGRQSQLPAGSRCGNQSPDACRAMRVEDPKGASVTSSRLGHALDLVQGACGEVADIQDLDDGSGGPAGVLRLAGRRVRRYRWGEVTGVHQATRVHGQHPTESRQLRDRGAVGVLGRADAGVGESAPSTAVSGVIREAGADVPAVVGGQSGRQQLLGVQEDGAVPDSLIPLDWIAAFTAAVALGTAQKSARAVGIDTQ
jgi:hypothetical protein